MSPAREPTLGPFAFGDLVAARSSGVTISIFHILELVWRDETWQMREKDMVYYEGRKGAKAVLVDGLYTPGESACIVAQTW